MFAMLRSATGIYGREGGCGQCTLHCVAIATRIPQRRRLHAGTAGECKLHAVVQSAAMCTLALCRLVYIGVRMNVSENSLPPSSRCS